MTNGYKEPASQRNVSPQQLGTLNENQKKDKKYLYFIYQEVEDDNFVFEDKEDERWKLNIQAHIKEEDEVEVTTYCYWKPSLNRTLVSFYKNI